MARKTAQDAVVRDFVQNVLGCGCPEEVFKDVAVKRGPTDIGGIPLTLSIRAGGRLLVYLTASEDLKGVPDSLEKLILAGKRARDREGLNRFRLVVASREAASDWQALGQAFHDIPGIDNRVHLHVIDAQTVPPLL